MEDKFDSAEYYDCQGDEMLTHRTPEEAVEAWLDGWMEPGCDVKALIHERGECEITAHCTEQIGDKWIEGLAESLLERAEEDLVESFGNPNDYDEECIERDDLKACLPAMIEAVRQVVAHFRVGRCEPVATRVLDEDEVEAMMREYNPHWFTGGDGKAEREE